MTTAQQFADISDNNPLPDLARYAAVGHRHICRKATEGISYHWFQGDDVADHAHRLGLIVGHYHWLRPDSSATAQAAFFVAAVKPHLHDGDWLMTDFEATSGVSDGSDVERAAQLHQFNTYVHDKLPGYPLYTYTGNWYLDGKPHCQAECKRWPVVMSDYSGVSTLPNPYGLRYVAWQFTDHAQVAGFTAPVDYNRWLTAPKPAPNDPNWSDTVTKDELEKMIDERAEEIAAQGLRSVLLGGDHAPFTEKKYGRLVHPKGVDDRLDALEHPKAAK